MKNISKHLLSLVLCLFVAECVHAQENTFDSAKHAVGFSAGGAGGSGITYRAYSQRSFIQGAFFARANSRDDIDNLLIGISYGHILSEISIVKALPPTALVFITGIEGQYLKEQFVEGVIGDEYRNEKALRTGAGIALEIGNTFSPGLLFSIGTTYVLAMEQINGNWDWNLGPKLNVAMLYNW